MKILYVLYTHNRGSVLKSCLDTLFNKDNTVWPTEMLVIDDNSQGELKNGLYSFARTNTQYFPVHFLSFASNQGYHRQWELVWNWIKTRDFDYIVHIESDYIFRKDAIAEAIGVLEATPLAVGVPGYSNPDYYNGKQTTHFPPLMKDKFGEDLAPRDLLHKPFDVDTNLGKISCQLTTNSCGTFIINWPRLKYLLDNNLDMWSRVFVNSWQTASDDGNLTSGISYYWYKTLNNGESAIDLDRTGPWIDICDYSIGSHKNGGWQSINGKNAPEGVAAPGVDSPKWKDEYATVSPR